MEIKTNKLFGNKPYAFQIQLTIETENVKLTEYLIPLDSDKVKKELIGQLENLVQQLKDHNESVDDYNK